MKKSIKTSSKGSLRNRVDKIAAGFLPTDEAAKRRNAWSLASFDNEVWRQKDKARCKVYSVTIPKLVASVVVPALITAALTMGLMQTVLITTEAGGGPVGDVIFNDPYEPSNPPVNVESTIPWTKADHNSGEYGGYEQAYTEIISRSYNGIATPDHVVFVNAATGKIEEGYNNSITFYGYGEQPYMDYVFADMGPSRGNAFTMRPLWMNFHSFSESGYLFNGKMENGYYTGYAIILQCGNTSGMLENDHTQPNTAALRLYYIDNERWDTESFSPGSMSGGTRTLIATFKTGIKDVNQSISEASLPYRVNVEIDPATRAFDVYIDGARRASVPAGEVAGGANGPTGFGFFTGYYKHDCTRLTRIRYEEITADVAPVPAVRATAEVRFVTQGTGTSLRAPEYETGFLGQGYAVEQPLTLVAGGVTYYLVGNSRNLSIRNAIREMYRDASQNPGVNVTTLYYINRDAYIPPPEKNASVGGGAWDSGSLYAPVQVTAGSEIEYSISLSAGCTAMMHNRHPLGFSSRGVFGLYIEGRGVGRGTMVDPERINFDYDKVTVVSLPESIASEADFQRVVGSQWNGRPILAYWDFTETDPQYNSNADTSKVYVWVTESDRLPFSDPNKNSTSFYDLYVGGGGGVILTPAKLDPSFRQGVFCTNFFNATEMNLGWLDTSVATDFDRLFAASLYSSGTHKTIDLTGFDFTNVTSWVEMFDFPGLPLSSNTKIIVSSESAKEWIQTRFGTSTKFSDYNPATDTGILVSPTAGSSGVRVTDTIPDGLTIIESSITQGNGIGYTLNGQTIVWAVPAGSLPADLTVKVTVDADRPDGTVFANTATVSYGGYSLNTCTTYHEIPVEPAVAEKPYMKVTVHFVDENGDVIKTEETQPAAPGSNYYLPMRLMDSFADSSKVWTYYDYEYADTTGAGKAVRQPNYPVFSNAGEPVPTFAAISENKHITLYFTSAGAVAVRFAELGNPSNILHNDEVYFMPPAFSPGSARRSGGEALTAAIDLSGEFGKIYTYANSFSINGGATQSGVPGVQNAQCEIILYFKTTWTVTEMFVSYTYDEEAGEYSVVVFESPGRTHTGLPGGYAFYALDDENEPLPEIPGHKYVGYHFERIETPMISGDPAEPVIDAVYADYLIIYVYEQDEAGAEDTEKGDGGGSGGGYRRPESKPEDQTGGEVKEEPPEEKLILDTDNRDTQLGSGGEEPEPGPAPPPAQQTDIPGGTDPGKPPMPNPGGALLQTEDGRFIEIGEDGVPRGEWHWDDDEGMWIYDEYPPLAELPQTGADGFLVHTLLLLGFALVGVGVSIFMSRGFSTENKRSTYRTQSSNGVTVHGAPGVQTRRPAKCNPPTA